MIEILLQSYTLYMSYTFPQNYVTYDTKSDKDIIKCEKGINTFLKNFFSPSCLSGMPWLTYILSYRKFLKKMEYSLIHEPSGSAPGRCITS